MEDETIMFTDVLAQRLNAFASLATTLIEIEDEDIRELGKQMLQRTVDSCTIQKTPAASLTVVK